MRRAAWGWAAVALAAGCEQPRTELVVRVESELAWGPGQAVQSVVLSVRRGGATGPLRSARTTALGEGGERRALPLLVGVTAGDDDVETPVWVEALGCAEPEGCREATALVAQRAVVRFTRGATQEVTLLLASACVGVTCALDERCAVASRRCEPATRAQDGLRPFVGSDAAVVTVIDATVDTGAVTDAGGDLDARANTAIDTSSMDAGAPPDGPISMDEPLRSDTNVPVSADAGHDMPSDDGNPASLDHPSTDTGFGTTCTDGVTRPCYSGAAATRGVGFCADGFQRCAGGRWGVECNGELRPQTETCNTIDDDCDGVVDNITTIPCYTGPPGTRDVGICHGGMQRCEGAMTPRCLGQVVPETREVCANGRDDNCNNMVDEASCL